MNNINHNKTITTTTKHFTEFIENMNNQRKEINIIFENYSN